MSSPDCKFGFSRLSFHVAEGVTRFKTNGIDLRLYASILSIIEFAAFLLLTNSVSYTISYSRG